MRFYPKGLLVAALFLAALILSLNFRLGIATGAVAVVAYVAIEMIGSGLGLNPFKRG